MPPNSNPTSKQNIDTTAENDEPPKKRAKRNAVEQTEISVLPASLGPVNDEASKTEVAQPANSKTCSICKSSFANDEELRNHRFSSHMARNYRCVECFVSFPARTQLKEHQKMHQPKCARIVRCSIESCTKDFRSMVELDKHFAENHRLAVLRCLMCGALFVNSCTLEIHKRQH
ncbi:AAEL005923-PA [Aedes aegypti]|uniref:AAEL005923-PA n=2 Tax=Aedes aegypti TaxID=7159 RepID=A0A1S4FC06_AEDAE|nr:oocyte zinc finger protein XlCOF14 isoform X2 [Aedes aegypti]EAT42538.1 AAEL005923-PA [Aedes aegypti]